MKSLSLQRRARLPVAVLAVLSAVGALLVALLAPAQPAQAVGLVPTAASITCATSRPPNGTILYAGISGGLGRLTIVNGLSQDGVVALVRGSSKAISVYVRARSSTTVGNIKDGTYTIYFTTGSLFSVCNGRFTRGAAYWRFNDRLPFVSPPGYTVATLTLQAVPGGNAPVSQVNPGDFPA